MADHSLLRWHREFWVAVYSSPTTKHGQFYSYPVERKPTLAKEHYPTALYRIHVKLK
jgi:hypothetical protein